MKKSNLKIGIYSPYFHIKGGGEKYLLSLAFHYSKKHDVSLYTDEKTGINAGKMLDIDLRSVRFDPSFLKSSFLEKIHKLINLDIFILMTDGSIPWAISKKNILVIQSPSHIPNNILLNRMKLKGWKVVCYSTFMQEIILDKLGVDAYILAPGINLEDYKKGEKGKDKIILNVGRFFFSHLHNKNQDLLANFFIKNYEKYFSGWKLIFAGAVTEKSGEKYFKDLNKNLGHKAIEYHSNLPYGKLLDLYNRAKIYWHAAGYGADREKDPQKFEHFGITTVEAMAAGSVPVVFEGGGQLDIVNNGKNGYFWKTTEDLLRITVKLINNEKLLTEMGEKARKRADKYSLINFYGQADKIFQA